MLHFAFFGSLLMLGATSKSPGAQRYDTLSFSRADSES